MPLVDVPISFVSDSGTPLGHFQQGFIAGQNLQHDADLAVLEAIGKEWREKEADWSITLADALTFHKLYLNDPKTRLITHIAELRQIAQGK